MTTETIAVTTIGRQATLKGHTVVVIGGSGGIGLETARLDIDGGQRLLR